PGRGRRARSQARLYHQRTGRSLWQGRHPGRAGMNMIAFESSRTATIKSSPSMAVSLAAKALRGRGEHVVDLSLGEPDFDTPAHVVEAAIEAMRKGITRYTAPDGLPELREAIVAKFKRENGLDYAMDEISIGNGAKQILFNAFLGTLE